MTNGIFSNQDAFFHVCCIGTAITIAVVYYKWRKQRSTKKEDVHHKNGVDGRP